MQRHDLVATWDWEEAGFSQEFFGISENVNVCKIRSFTRVSPSRRTYLHCAALILSLVVCYMLQTAQETLSNLVSKPSSCQSKPQHRSADPQQTDNNIRRNMSHLCVVLRMYALHRIWVGFIVFPTEAEAGNLPRSRTGRSASLTL